MPQRRPTFEDRIADSVKEAISSYLYEVTIERMKELLRPELASLVKEEFNNEVTPAVISLFNEKFDEQYSKLDGKIREIVCQTLRELATTKSEQSG